MTTLPTRQRARKYPHAHDYYVWSQVAFSSTQELMFEESAGEFTEWATLDVEALALPALWQQSALQRGLEEGIKDAIAQRLATVDVLHRHVAVLQTRVEQLSAEMDVWRPVLRELSNVLPRTQELINALAKNYAQVQRIATRSSSDWIPVGSFAPEAYDVIQPITVVVSPCADEFEAGIVDINTYSTGDTLEEAVTNLKSYLLDLFDRYCETPDEQLGPEPLRQKAYLLSHVRRR